MTKTPIKTAPAICANCNQHVDAEYHEHFAGTRETPEEPGGWACPFCGNNLDAEVDDPGAKGDHDYEVMKDRKLDEAWEAEQGLGIDDPEEGKS